MVRPNETISEPGQGWMCFRLIGGIAALLAALVFRRWLSAEFSMFQSLGVVQIQTTPSTPLEWFSLLQTNKFVGLLLLNAFDTVNYLLAALMYLGIYSLIRNHDKAYMRFAMFLVAIGTAIYLTSNQAMNILSLSNQYFSSGTEFQKQLILAAGQYALTINNPVAFGTGVFWGYMFFYAAGLILSMGILRNGPISKWIAVVGVIANAFGLGYFVTSLFRPSLGIIPALGTAPLNLIWYIVIGIQLIRFMKTEV
ncbi:MAG: DUF4386 family protein [Anaerolineales bacterium]